MGSGHLVLRVMLLELQECLALLVAHSLKGDSFSFACNFFEFDFSSALLFMFIIIKKSSL